MSKANIYQKHLLIIPEDAAYSVMAGGFLNYFAVADQRVQVMRIAGGWSKLVASFLEDYESKLQNKNCHVLLLLDLDKQ